MKNRIFTILAVLMLATLAAGAQSKTKINPVGKWKFEAPTAPEGYTTGNIVIGMTDNKHTATMSFTGSEYQLPAEQVKVSADSLVFSVYIEGDVINVTMKLQSESKMSGKATYSQGEVPLTATKEVPQASSK